MNKTQEIEKALSAPIEIGNHVNVKFTYTDTVIEKKGKINNRVQVEKIFSNGGRVLEINDGSAVVKFFGAPTVPVYPSAKGGYVFPLELITNDTSDCGANPFIKELPRINFINSQINELFRRCSYGRKSDNYSKLEYDVITPRDNDPDNKYVGCTWGGVNFDPYVIDANGNKSHYQRGYVWNEDQKRLLIDSIYNGIEIGKFIFLYNSWEKVQRQMDASGHGFNYDCIDGKQRVGAIVEFVQDKFKDSFGNYFSDLSTHAQRKFFDYDKFALGTMDERTKEQDIISTFLTLNFTGVPMSKDHLDYVRSIVI